MRLGILYHKSLKTSCSLLIINIKNEINPKCAVPGFSYHNDIGKLSKRAHPKHALLVYQQSRLVQLGVTHLRHGSRRIFRDYLCLQWKPVVLCRPLGCRQWSSASPVNVAASHERSIRPFRIPQICILGRTNQHCNVPSC